MNKHEWMLELEMEQEEWMEVSPQARKQEKREKEKLASKDLRRAIRKATKAA